MTAQQSQQMLLQQLQGMMGQMAGLMQQASVLAPQPDVAPAAVSEQPAPPIPTCKKEFHKVKQVRGIEGAKEEQAKLMNGESDIVMDEDDPVFYMIMKDENGKSPRRITIGRFTLEDEPEPPKYVTQDDLASFKQDILNAIKGGTK